MLQCPRLRPLILIAGAALCGAALAAEPPVLKSGLWEVVRNNSQQPERKSVTTMCLDDTVQAQMREFGMGATKELCSQNDRSFANNKMTMTATCKLPTAGGAQRPGEPPGSTMMKVVSVMTFNGNTSYHMDGSATYDPPLLNMRESKTSIDAKWVGPCGAGQQPGDVTLETGQTVNIKQMMQKK